MKTIEEAAEEYAKKESKDFPDRYVRAEMTTSEIAAWLDDAFTAGVKFAQQWYPVEEELPEFTGEQYQILAKGHPDHPGKVIIWTVGISENELALRNIFTHWRPIELK